MLSYTKILAPFDGVVTRKLAEVGDLALPGKPLLEMEDASLRRLEAEVPESLIGRGKPGGKFSVRAPDLDGITATVSEIAPSADPARRTFLMKFDLPADTALRSRTRANSRSSSTCRKAARSSARRRPPARSPPRYGSNPR